jgi:hypothetical protein
LVCCSVSTNTWASRPSTSSSPSRRIWQVGDHARRAEVADLDGDVELVVEARGRLVASGGLDDLEVDPASIIAA